MQDSTNRPVEDEWMYEMCTQLLSVDRTILFSALAHKSGYLMALAASNSKHRKASRNSGSTYSEAHSKTRNYPESEKTLESMLASPNFLTEVELEKYIFQSGIIWGIHKLWERKLGHIQYVISSYDEMHLVTIFLDNNHFLLMAVDSRSKRSNVDRIVSEKVVPSLERLSRLMPR
jgi:hypothetical protein